MKKTRHRAFALEAEVLAEFGLPMPERLVVPKGLTLFGDRRSLRVPLADVASSYQRASASLELRFTLPPGSYATVLLDTLLPDGYDEGQGPDGAHPET